MSEAGGLPLGVVDGLEIDDDRVVTIAHDDPLRGLVGRIDLLVRNERGDIDEVPGSGVRLVNEESRGSRAVRCAEHEWPRDALRCPGARPWLCRSDDPDSDRHARPGG